MLSLSLKPDVEHRLSSIFIPVTNLDNFNEVFTKSPFGQYTLNSLVVADSLDGAVTPGGGAGRLRYRQNASVRARRIRADLAHDAGIELLTMVHPLSLPRVEQHPLGVDHHASGYRAADHDLGDDGLFEDLHPELKRRPSSMALVSGPLSATSPSLWPVQA